MSEAENTSRAATAAEAQEPDIEKMVLEIVRMLVDAPDEAYAETEEDHGEQVVWVGVAQEDVARIIGRNGRTIRALRNIVEAAGRKLDERWTVEIDEEDEDEGDGDVEP
jgi:predicted RNA-binding protein YlqC (UPF0109 family)